MRPPMSSDEEDDYDGFSFGCEFEKPERTIQQIPPEWLIKQKKEEDELNNLIHHVKTGDLNSMKRALLKRYGSEAKINYNEYLKDGWTLMLHAVFNLQYDVVLYLIKHNVNVNHQADSLTPLMMICKYEANASDIDIVLDITKLLLDHGAIVNTRDKTGYTPFMYACTYGNKDIVELLLPLSAIEATDNSDFTALHYAVQNKHIEIVKILLKAGADTEVVNSYGLKPRDVAIALGHSELEKLFPVEVNDDYLYHLEQYRTYEDLAPLIFPDHEQPAYWQDIPTMLKGMRAENCIKQFHDAKVTLAEFLTIDDNRLQSIGIDFEYQRKRILQGLLKFHRHPYSPKSIEIVSKTQSKNMYQYYEMYANYLKHLVMMRSAFTYLMRMGGPKNVSQKMIVEICAVLNDIQKDVALLEKHIQQLSKFSTNNPLFIGSTEKRNQRYKRILGPLLKYSIIIGIGVFLRYKLSA